MDVFARLRRVACSSFQAYWHCEPAVVKAEVAARLHTMHASTPEAPKVHPIGLYNQVARELWSKVEELGADKDLIERVNFFQKHGYERHEERPMLALPCPADYQRCAGHSIAILFAHDRYTEKSIAYIAQLLSLQKDLRA
jgi:hypothetical protein